MKKNKRKMMVLLVLILAIVAIIGTSYALWQLAFSQGDSNLVTSGCFKITYSDKNPIDLTDASPISDELGTKLTPYEFTLTNLCDNDASYQVNLNVLNDTNLAYDNLVKIKYQSENPKLLKDNTVVETTLDNAVKTYNIGSGRLASSGEVTLNLRLWISEDATLTSSDYEKVFNSKITVEATYVPKKVINKNELYNKIAKQAALDNTSSEFVTSDTGINFGEAPSDTNGKGVYTIANTKDDEYPVHYFRGAVTNNNVKFANFCWKIVRTTETGGVKLIYNGEPNSEGGCTNTTGELTQIGTSAFNTSYDSADYVGYMYPETNENNSAIKTAIDTWYETNMNDYTNYLEDTVWCVDRSVYETERSNIFYGASWRNIDTKKPSIVCPNDNDKFTVNSENGNGKLTYPVALLTADEATLAGNGNSGYSNTSYLYTNQWWWVLSPARFYSSYAVVFDVFSDGYLDNHSTADRSSGVRPSVSLAPGTMVGDSGDGSQNSPYEVTVE